MKKLFLLSVLFAALAAISAYAYLSGIKKEYSSMSGAVSVVIANQTIAQGSLIKKENLSQIEVPKKYKQPKSFNAIAELLSKDGKSSFIALSPIEEGEQILPAKVADSGKDTGIIHIIPDGYKALVLNFDKENINILKPGNRIDIFSVLEYEDENKKFQVCIFTAAQNILILSVGDNLLGSFARRKTQEGEDKNGLITAAVTSEEAQKILLAGEKGVLKFIIRPIGDNGDIKIKPLKMSDLSGDIARAVNINSQRESNISGAELLEIAAKYGGSFKR